MGFIGNVVSYLYDMYRKLNMGISDFAEIVILSYLIYKITVWIRNTRAWVLLKGMIVIAIFLLVAYLTDMNTIIYISTNFFSIVITALIIILQPELRKALEDIGKNDILGKIQLVDKSSRNGRYSDKTVQGIVKACSEMSRVKTGALIVIEKDQILTDYISTGIEIKGVVSSQLLVNIFEHNTPLHDGAVIIRGDEILAATCYLPLSDNRALSKELGTRHRAALGTSENTDALIIAVSEETGGISVALEGVLSRGLGPNQLQDQLVDFQNKDEVHEKTKDKISIRWKGHKSHEK
ncbi:MAG: diadenylate cyclase CdaA [Lachnospiraceae bacterium]